MTEGVKETVEYLRGCLEKDCGGCLMPETIAELLGYLDVTNAEIDRINALHLEAKGYVVVGPSDDLSEVGRIVAENADLKDKLAEMEAKIGRLTVERALEP